MALRSIKEEFYGRFHTPEQRRRMEVSPEVIKDIPTKKILTQKGFRPETAEQIAKGELTSEQGFSVVEGTLATPRTAAIIQEQKFEQRRAVAINLAQEQIKQQQLSRTGIPYTENVYQSRYYEPPPSQTPPGQAIPFKTPDPVTKVLVPTIAYRTTRPAEPPPEPSYSYLSQRQPQTFGQKVLEKEISAYQKVDRFISEKLFAPKEELQRSQRLARQQGISKFEVKLLEGAQTLPEGMIRGGAKIAFSTITTTTGLAFPSTRQDVLAETKRSLKETPRGMLSMIDIRQPEKIVPLGVIIYGGVKTAVKHTSPKTLTVPRTINMRAGASQRYIESIKTPFGKRGPASRGTILKRDTHTIIDIKPVEPVVSVMRGRAKGIGVVTVSRGGRSITQLSKGRKVSVYDVGPQNIAQVKTITFKGRVPTPSRILAQEAIAPTVDAIIKNRGRFVTKANQNAYLQPTVDYIQQLQKTIFAKRQRGYYDQRLLTKQTFDIRIQSGVTKITKSRATQQLRMEKLGVRVEPFVGKARQEIFPQELKGQRAELVFGKLQPPKDVFKLLSEGKLTLPKGDVYFKQVRQIKAPRLTKEITTTPRNIINVLIKPESRLPEYGAAALESGAKLLETFSRPLRGKRAQQIFPEPRLIGERLKVSIGQRSKIGRPIVSAAMDNLLQTSLLRPKARGRGNFMPIYGATPQERMQEIEQIRMINFQQNLPSSKSQLSPTEIAVTQTLPMVNINTNIRLDNAPDVIIRNDVRTRLSQKQTFEQVLKQTTKQRTLTDISTVNLNTLSPQKPQPMKPLSNKMPLPFLMGNEDIGDREGAFDVMVKEQGKFNKMNKKSLSWADAHALGGYLVDNSSAATYKPQKAKGKPNKLDMNIPRFGPNKFYKKGNMMIEHNVARIDTPGELQDITAKGLMKLHQNPMLRKPKRTRGRF